MKFIIRIFLEITFLLFVSQVCVPILQATVPKGTTTEKVMLTGGRWCSQQQPCIGFAETQELIPESVLRDAFSIAYTKAPDFQPIARTVVKQRTRIISDNLHAAGMFTPITNTITINKKYLTASSSVQASLIAHEAQHASDVSIFQAIMFRTKPELCYSSELRAFAMGAYVYEKVKTPDEHTWLDDIVVMWKANNLKQLVMASDDYWRQCINGNPPTLSMTKQ